jgi:hypothetical protein
MEMHCCIFYALPAPSPIENSLGLFGLDPKNIINDLAREIHVYEVKIGIARTLVLGRLARKSTPHCLDSGTCASRCRSESPRLGNFRPCSERIIGSAPRPAKVATRIALLRMGFFQALSMVI